MVGAVGEWLLQSGNSLETSLLQGSHFLFQSAVHPQHVFHVPLADFEVLSKLRVDLSDLIVATKDEVDFCGCFCEHFVELCSLLAASL